MDDLGLFAAGTAAGKTTLMDVHMVPADRTDRAAGAVGLADVPSLFAARRAEDSSPEKPDSRDSQSVWGRIDVERLRGVWVLTLHGDHDFSTQPGLREQLQLVTDAGGPIVVDLSCATFLDSTVIGAIALASTRDGRAGAALNVVAPVNYVGTRMVELVGIGSAVPVYPTRAEAVAAHGREFGEAVVEKGEEWPGAMLWLGCVTPFTASPCTK